MSDRKLDSKGRWRSRVVAFRVSDEEAELLNRLVDISGLTKQDYLIKKTTDHKVVVKGSIRVFGALKAQLTFVYEELKRLDKVTPKNDELMELIKVISMSLLKIEENENLKEQQRVENFEKKMAEQKRLKNSSMGNRKLKSFRDEGERINV